MAITAFAVNFDCFTVTNAIRHGNADTNTPTHGTSHIFFHSNIFGAWPSRASAYSARLYMSNHSLGENTVSYKLAFAVERQATNTIAFTRFVTKGTPDLRTMMT